MYKYYTTQRPPSLGAIPKGAVEVKDYGEKKTVKGNIEAYGEVEYKHKLDNPKKYELLPEVELEQDRQQITVEETKTKLKNSGYKNINVKTNIESIKHITAENKKTGRKFKLSVLQTGTQKMGLKGVREYE